MALLLPDHSPFSLTSHNPQMIVTTRALTLSVRLRHNQELSLAPARRGDKAIVVVGAGWPRPPELATADCYGNCSRPQQPVRPLHGGGGREGGRVM